MLEYYIVQHSRAVRSAMAKDTDQISAASAEQSKVAAKEKLKAAPETMESTTERRDASKPEALTADHPDLSADESRFEYKTTTYQQPPPRRPKHQPSSHPQKRHNSYPPPPNQSSRRSGESIYKERTYLNCRMFCIG